MQRAIMIVLACGLIASSVSAQVADQPSQEVPKYGDFGGESPYSREGLPGRGERRIDPRKTQQLIQRWKDSKEAAEREKLETGLRQALTREFSARLAVHEKEIKELEEKVRQLRERLALRKEKQDEIVEHRLQQILREAQGLGWGSEGGHGNSTFQYRTTTDTTAIPSDDPFAPSSDLQPVGEAHPADDLFDDPTAARP